MKQIILAGGCFWGIEEFFARKSGVIETETGYANCRIDNPDYRLVCTGQTGCAEAVRILFDEEIISEEEILDAFFSVIDPTVKNRQGPDIGTQYRTGLYYTGEEQKQVFAQKTKELAVKIQQPVVTEVVPLENFFPAEEYHQRYLKKNPGGYCHISLD